MAGRVDGTVTRPVAIRLLRSLARFNTSRLHSELVDRTPEVEDAYYRDLGGATAN